MIAQFRNERFGDMSVGEEFIWKDSTWKKEDARTAVCSSEESVPEPKRMRMGSKQTVTVKNYSTQA